MLILYGADLSTPSNKVRFVMNYIGLNYDYRKVSLKDGEHKKEEYKKIHPVSKIPAIDDDGFVLFESNAITKYLSIKHGSDLYPEEQKQQAIVDQWMDFVSLHIGAAINRVVFNRLFAPIAKIPVDERSLADGLGFINRFLRSVENFLSGSKYLAGEELSLADINLLSVLDPVEAAKIDISGYPNINRLRDSLKGEDFYTRCHKEYGERLKQIMERKHK